MKTVVVLGALGMAGHVITDYLSNECEYNVLGVAHRPGKCVNQILDVLDFDRLENYFEEINADVVINCIGALVLASNTDISRAILLNSYFPHLLSELGNKMNFKLVHISTDCVFSGKEGGYTENSICDGDDNYARTKALGEINSGNHITIRTSIIGPELKSNGTGLMDWFFKHSRIVNGYSEAHWSGVTTLELAKVAHFIIEHELSGLLHLCPPSKISKFELLLLFNSIWDFRCEIRPNDTYKVDKSMVCTREDFSYVVPDYKTMLEDMKNWMKVHSQFYPHYSFG
jgi:dTDP-4-dehydrorhamnose reductase